MSKIIILLDYEENFLISIKDLIHYTSMDVEKIIVLLTRYGHSVEVIKYSDLHLQKSYLGYYILYQSAEDIGSFYKSYILDILYHLQQTGARLLPSFTLFLANHNKNYMELVRSGFKDSDLKTITSQLYANYDEAIHDIKTFPVVLKSAEGSGSSQVYLANNSNELKKIIKKLSGVFIVNSWNDVKDFIIYSFALRIINKVQSKYRGYSFYRKKFIAQNYITGMGGDYKVLFFGGKYYTMYRKNRENDFRASGSGKFYSVPDIEIPPLLNFSRKLTLEIDFPIIAMDIGFDGDRYHLLEFQFVHIGPYALQCSEYYYEFIDHQWIKRDGKSDLEEEFCRSINEYVTKIDQ